MFFKKKSKREAALESEVEFLRSLVKELNDKLMSLSGDAFLRYSSEKRTDALVQRPSLHDTITQKISGMEAVTDKEKKEKEEAIGQIHALMGGGR